jgi:FlaA1/EpsC-like NDP-sugar epimerase
MPDKRFLILGGGGLVGSQIARLIAEQLSPECIIVLSLDMDDVNQ